MPLLNQQFPRAASALQSRGEIPRKLLKLGAYALLGPSANPDPSLAGWWYSAIPACSLPCTRTSPCLTFVQDVDIEREYEFSSDTLRMLCMPSARG